MTQKVFIRLGFVLTILVGMSSVSFAQLKKANGYFKQEQFNDAIKYYTKVLNKDESNKEATQNIAFAYRKLKDYPDAEIFYAKATELNPNEGENYL